MSEKPELVQARNVVLSDTQEVQDHSLCARHRFSPPLDMANFRMPNLAPTVNGTPLLGLIAAL